MSDSTTKDHSMKELSMKENTFSLLRSENYNKEFDISKIAMIKGYTHLVTEYYKFISDKLKITNNGFSRFIIIRGLDTITNVFLQLLYYTKNLELTCFHCQKSFYFYVEFVGQISDIEKTFLQLSTRDAAIYVYKKTLYEVRPEFKKVVDKCEVNNQLDMLHSNINIIQTYLLKIIHSTGLNSTIINDTINLSEKLCNITDISNNIMLEKITDILFAKIDNPETFFKINHLLMKKVIKSLGVLVNASNNCCSPEFDTKLMCSDEHFISWLIANH